MTMICGIDTGGTFTDCILLWDDRVERAKVPSTPADFSVGFFQALETVADRVGLSLEELMPRLDHLIYGTTVATNAMVQRTGAKTGLLTTRGFRDTLPMMRAIGRVAGLPPEQLMHLSATSKPEPIIPKSLIGEATERIDCMGSVIVPLDEEQCAREITRLLAQGIESLAIAFLWSFINPVHELRAKQLAQQLCPDLYVTCSAELARNWGEYERTATAAINAYVGPTTKRYVESIARGSQQLGIRSPILIVQCTGGAVSVRDAAQHAVRTIGSGPTAGIMASRQLGLLLDHPNVICTDAGGTTFDVGLIWESEPIFSTTSILSQYVYFVPSVDVQSIGAGGGSIAWVEPTSGSLRVGPRSAGAQPGPACYGLGGAEPTVTDAALVLGYLNPEYFLDGKLQLDRAAAEDAVGMVARGLGISIEEAASGIVRIAEFRMADLIRKVTVQRGHDPRDFVLFAYGGAGPVHAGVFGAELGVQKVIIPAGDAASLWSAFGAASSNIVQIFERSHLLDAPFPPHEVNAAFEELQESAAEWLDTHGVRLQDRVIQRSMDIRYKAQVNEVAIDVPNGHLDREQVSEILERFETTYAALYGPGSGYAQAGMESTVLRVRAVGQVPKPELPALRQTSAIPAVACRPSRQVYWPELGVRSDTQVYRGQHLQYGNRVSGPAVIEFPDTTVVTHPGHMATIDAYGNIQLSGGE
jgi:N-methylhydantoinase A